MCSRPRDRSTCSRNTPRAIGFSFSALDYDMGIGTRGHWYPRKCRREARSSPSFIYPPLPLISIYGIISLSPSLSLFLSGEMPGGGIAGSMIRNEKRCVISGYAARCAGDREQKGPRVTFKTYRTTEISLTARSIRPFSAALAREDCGIASINDRVACFLRGCNPRM